MTNLTKLSGIQLNCRSVNNKLGEIKLLLYSEKPEFLALSETWITKYEPKFLNYSTEWKHRVGRGGGLGFVIKRGIQYSNIDLVQFPGGVLEQQAIKIYLNKGSIIIMNIYNPNLNVTLLEMMHYVGQLGNKYMILGDFNAHSTILSSNGNRQNPTGRMLEDLTNGSDICIANPIDFFTHLDVATGQQACLDLCLVPSNLAAETRISGLRDIGSDHIPVAVEVKCQPSLNNIIVRKKWKISKDNLVSFSENIASSNIDKPNNIDTLNKDFTDRLCSSAEIQIGRTSGKIKTRKSAIWWDSECLEKVRERRRARKRLVKYPTLENINNYKTAALEADKLKKNKRTEKFKEFISSITFETPPSEVWKKIRALKGYNVSSVSPLEHDGGTVVDPKTKANLFAKFFQEIAISGQHLHINNDFYDKLAAASRDSSDDYNRDISCEEIKYALQLTRNSSPGEDEISYTLLKSLQQTNLDELQLIFNQSFKTGIIPKSWKEGMMIPIPKPGKPKTLLSSYRPIALLSCIGKTMERIVKSRLEYIVEKDKLLIDSQCGFRRGQSTIDVLLRLENCIRKALSNQEVCLVAYVDLKSAFDSIWGEGLIYKLIGCGIKGNLIQWLDNYFRDRSMRVSFEGTTSDAVPLLAGTPQGAVLSPLLFNLMLRDIPQTEGIQLYIYADDITVSCSGDNPTVVRQQLQRYLDSFSRWAESWGLIINPQKTVMQFFTRKKIQCPVVKMKRKTIEFKKEQKLLGLVFDAPLLTWKPHITALKRDCSKRIDLMKTLSSSVWGASSKMLRRFYISYVRAKIDYGSILYGSAAKTYIDKVDTIQNACLRLILGGRNTTPILSLQAESCIPPLQLHRDYLNIKQYIRLKYQSKNFATTEMLNIGTYKTNADVKSFNSFTWRAGKSLNTMGMLPIKKVAINPNKIAPWHSIEIYIKTDFEDRVMDNLSFMNYTHRHFSNYKFLFTDGSKTTESTASALYSPSHGQAICWKLRAEHSVIGAELFAIWRALIYIDDLKLGSTVIFTDSRSALQLISSKDPTSYLNVVSNIQNLLLTLNADGSVLLHWVKAHCGIEGNEIADKSANKGHENDKTELYELTQYEIISILRTNAKIYWNDYWKFTTELTGKGMFLRNIRSHIGGIEPVAKFKNRRQEVVIHRLRMGHAGLNEYLHRFNMNDTNECEVCQVPESVQHYLFFCSAFQGQREVMFRNLSQIGVDNPTLKTILGGDDSIIGKRKDIFRFLVHYIKLTNKINLL